MYARQPTDGRSINAEKPRPMAAPVARYETGHTCLMNKTGNLEWSMWSPPQWSGRPLYIPVHHRYTRISTAYTWDQSSRFQNYYVANKAPRPRHRKKEKK